MSYFQAQGTTIVTRRGYSGTGGVTDFFKNLGKGAVEYVQGAEQAKGAAAYATATQPQPQQSSGPPSWLIPVAVIGVVGAVVYMRRRK